MRSCTPKAPLSSRKRSAENSAICSAPARAGTSSAASSSDARTASRSSARSEGPRASAPEADRRRLALRRGVELEVAAGPEAEAVRHEVRGEGLAARVEVAHQGVVVAARVLDRLLEGGELALEREERLVRLELRVGLGHGEQRADRLRERSLGRRP